MPAALDAQKKSEMVDRLFTVFRDHGYEGSSLADLSQSTGLGKSSLYHHFPRGKEQMAEVVLEQAKTFLQSAVADVVRSAAPWKVRARSIVAAFDKIYANGRTPCVLGRLASADLSEAGHRMAGEVFEIWIDAIAELARDRGLSSVRSRQFAEDWTARVQGALILYAASGNSGPFERAMHALVDLEERTAASPDSTSK